MENLYKAIRHPAFRTSDEKLEHINRLILDDAPYMDEVTPVMLRGLILEVLAYRKTFDVTELPNVTGKLRYDR